MNLFTFFFSPNLIKIGSTKPYLDDLNLKGETASQCFWVLT